MDSNYYFLDSNTKTNFESLSIILKINAPEFKLFYTSVYNTPAKLNFNKYSIKKQLSHNININQILQS